MAYVVMVGRRSGLKVSLFLLTLSLWGHRVEAGAEQVAWQGFHLQPHGQVQWRCAQSQERSPEVWKGFIGAALSPSQCYRNPLVSLLPLPFGDMGGKAGGRLAFLGERRPFFGAETRWWEK